MSDIAASVVITSRNRKDDLLEAVASCFTQTVPVEVIYLDDASDDGSHLAVAERFPQVRIFREEQRTGYISLRNKGAQLARSNFIFSIDDDAMFTSPHIVEQTIREFDDPRIGAVAIPFKNVRISDEILQRAPDDNDVYATCTFIGTAHALRRDVFLRLGGYREFLVHQGEESDYCIRMLEEGYVVRLGTADLIHHFVSPKRDLIRQHYFGTRNRLLFFWCNADPARLPFYLVAATCVEIARAVRLKALRVKLRAAFDAYRDALRHRDRRRPVSPTTFRTFRMLTRRPTRLSRVVGRLNTRGRPHQPPATEIQAAQIGRHSYHGSSGWETSPAIHQRNISMESSKSLRSFPPTDLESR
jgi:GT2 family glycosyltransferase